MATVPQSRTGKLEFYEAHFAPWTGNAVAIGLTPESVTALGTLTDTARTAYDNLVAIRQQAKAATLAFHDAVDAMHGDPGAGADMIATIKNHAQITDDPNVYVLAEIPAPAPPVPGQRPGQPREFTVGLGQLGAVELRWKCTNPTGTTGTTYEVQRRIGAAGEMTFVGNVGDKAFTDDTLPGSAAGALGGVTYAVTAVRGGLRGPVAAFTVNFGATTEGGAAFGNMTVTPVDPASVKMAA